MIRALRHPSFRRLFSAQVLSLLGTGLMTMALALIAYDLGGDRAGVILGSIFTLKMVAYVGFAPIAGALVARVPVKPLLIGLDLARVALVAFLPFVDAIWQVYLLVFLFQLCSAAFTPAFQSLIPEILPDEKVYAEALSLSRLAYNLETMFSPVLAGLLLLVLVPSQLFLGTAAAFALSAAFVASSTLPQRAARTAEKFVRRLRRGFDIYLRTPRLHGLFCVNIAVSLVGAWVLVNTVLYARQALGGDVQTFTQLMTAYGFGSIVAALAVPRLLGVVHPRTVMISGAAALGALPLLILAPASLVAALPLWAALGAATSLVLTPGGLILTRSAVGGNRPAIFAAQFSLSHSGWLLTYPLAGWLGSAIGIENALVAMALASLGFTALAIRLWPVHDPLERRHTHHGAVAEHGGAEARRGRPSAAAFSHEHPFYIDDDHPVWAMEE